MKTNSLLAQTAIVVCAVAVPSLFVLLAGKNPVDTWYVLLSYTLGTRAGFAEVVVYAIPLMFIGLGVCIAFRAGIFNIGGDGQLICGAVLAVGAAPYLDGLGQAGLPAFLLLGFLGGAALGALVGWLRARFGSNEIIVTIMMNYVALQLLAWVIRGPLQEPTHIFPRSYRIAAEMQLPLLFEGTRIHAGLLVAAGMVVLVYVLLLQANFGFKLQTFGQSPGAASYAGIGATSITVGSMLLSGGFAGLAGAVEVSGLYHKLEDNFADGFGLAAIAVALMARLNPLLLPLPALLFGIFYVGSGALQRQLGIPFPIVWIVEAVVILAFLASGAVKARPVGVKGD